MNSTDLIKPFRVIPVVAIEDADLALPMAESLSKAGLPCAEIVLRTKAGLEAIRRLAQRGDFMVGAGTVLTIESAEAVIKAGAKFVVAPGFNPKVVGWCLDNEVPVFPGVATPTEIEQALAFGLSTLKFFPAEAMGGIKTIKALADAYRMISFLPTGGINRQNLLDYLSHPRVVACGGSWMVKQEWLANRNFAAIEKETESTLKLINNQAVEATYGK